ncbi:CDP-diacylglycerol--serine O-phosphatidyltransferase [Megasphaera cerevisiae DSM 20462]|uniref:CDP-diacylglycerol--serine O-phosphatidyltransferase n=1 Tax=Megasphaera cerevisiae DSM 20462 TaxID=1122219 RepID=A0A0J6WX82_9FIRM|nr:CDP-alcohol phosphatidyltransferase family protein [Megasphaera cerevisiae]KMO86452.1 CDP-diacylglycerol--serine O-phosphatidyltransferase [Megasphaera cerevisiae DSM 20462]OKY53395.1 CDP-diacylglycerol--serine O-phosphatidyltransferase [Megasphaera cerevisiae]SJZ95012.1 CDP-diacylglycerol---serine O-phosphatidyltransferase [Megasphaera cerevisiae DSM 20462]
MKNIIPCLFTSGNLAFGVLSMIMTLHGMFAGAGLCILLAMLCDACDGRSARALGVAGEFGKELDSLSDCVSFGAASGFLIYTYALQDLGWIGAVPAVLYAVFGGLRLARFNLNTTVVHGYFQGMPIPNGGCLIATYVISGAVLPSWLVGIFVLALGYHLVSKIHNPDFKGASPDTLHKSALAISVIFGILVLIFVDWHLIITMPFLLYIVFGLVNTAMNAASAH